MISIYAIPIKQVLGRSGRGIRLAAIESPNIDFYEKAMAILDAGYDFSFTEAFVPNVVFRISMNEEIVADSVAPAEPIPRLSYPRIFVNLVENFYKERFDDDKTTADYLTRKDYE